MIPLTLGTIAEWCGGQIAPEHAGLTITGISTDTRRIGPGQLFVPLMGERFDGHAFISQARESGAAATISDRAITGSLPVIYVEDTLQALAEITSGYRSMLTANFIAITGSVGKTTTKEMLACMMQTKYKTAKSAGNYNNNIGLPLTIMDINGDCEVAVVELGMNHFGEMTKLTAMARPNTVLITNIGTMHIENLGSREGILKAKLEILKGLAKNGTAIFNGDEPLLWNLRETIGCKTLYFGYHNEDVDVRASDPQSTETGIRFTVTGFGRTFDVELPVAGEHNMHNAVGAITAALLYGVEPEAIQQALKGFQNTGMRQKTYQKYGYTIIEDCYNAGPESMEAALNVLGDFKTEGRKIAVLGDMLELGNRSNAEHYRIGRIAVGKVNLILAYGTASEHIIDGAITGGMSTQNAMHFDARDPLVAALLHRARPGDVLLFKGSRGMKMELILEAFLQRLSEE